MKSLLCIFWKEGQAIDTLKAHCNSCNRTTNHYVLHEEVQNWEETHDRNSVFLGQDAYRLIKCAGCESVKMLHEDWFSGVTDEDGRPIVSQTYYPPAISRPEPRWLNDITFPFGPENEIFVGELLKEVYSALHNGSRRLAVMGARSLIEYLMLSRISDQGSFIKNMNEFESRGFLSKHQRETVEPILEAGHAAIHRGFHPSSQDVSIVIDVTESLVETLYIHQKRASSLKERVPPRKSKREA